MCYGSSKCTTTRELNHYRALRRAIGIYDHAIMNYRKKYFRTQNSKKTASSHNFSSSLVTHFLFYNGSVNRRFISIPRAPTVSCRMETSAINVFRVTCSAAFISVAAVALGAAVHTTALFGLMFVAFAIKAPQRRWDVGTRTKS